MEPNPTRFEYEVRVKFTMSEDDIDFLIKLASSHYDARCRSVARPGHDSFLYGMKNVVEFSKGLSEVPEHRLNASQLNLLLKILESPFNDRPDLTNTVWELFQAANNEARRVNP